MRMRAAFTMDASESPAALTANLQELVDTASLRWIFVGGKGGVGKTTTSCSLAVQLAQRRESVLIVSTDPAHNIGDAFAQKFSNTPQRVNGFENLFAMEVSSEGSRSAEMLGQLSEGPDGDDLGLMSVLSDVLNAFPGIDEALSFAQLMQAIRAMSYSVIVFDTAPTGHTMRLIGFPDLLERGLEKIGALRDKFAGAISMARSMSNNAITEDDLYEKLDSFKALTSSVKATFQDPSLTTFVCVCIPEFLSVYETERLVQALAKHRMDCGNIVVNQVLFPVTAADAQDVNFALAAPGDADTPEVAELRAELRKAQAKVEALQESVDTRRKMQSKYLLQIQELYSEDFHVVPLPVQPKEVRGIQLLRNFGELLLTTRELPILL